MIARLTSICRTCGAERVRSRATATRAGFLASGWLCLACNLLTIDVPVAGPVPRLPSFPIPPVYPENRASMRRDAALRRRT